MDRILRPCVGACALLVLAVAAPVAASDGDLDRALSEIESLRERVEELEAAQPADDAAAPEPDDAPPRLLSKLGSALTFYGFLRLDAVYDDSLPNDTQVIGYVRSEDDDPALGSRRNEDTFTVYPRLTRFGVDLAAPPIEALGPFALGGRLEIDFYAFPASDSRNLIRMRHAYLDLESDCVTLLAGQTWDLISPLYPAVNADLVMWGAGNLGDRRPQLRLDLHPRLGPGRLLLQSAVGLTGADDGADADGNGILDGEFSGRPTVQARLAYQTVAPWTEAARLEVGVWGHRAWEKLDDGLGPDGERRFDSEAVGFDLRLPLFRDRIWLLAEGWIGRNVDDVRGGIFQGVNPNTGEEIGSRGGFVELGTRPFAWDQLAFGYSTDDPDDADLTPADARVNRKRNQILYVANTVSYFHPLVFGFEYLHWTTRYVGLDPGTDNRFKAWIAYYF